jgi:hypothetical protein
VRTARLCASIISLLSESAADCRSARPARRASRPHGCAHYDFLRLEPTGPVAALHLRRAGRQLSGRGLLNRQMQPNEHEAIAGAARDQFSYLRTADAAILNDGDEDVHLLESRADLAFKAGRSPQPLLLLRSRVVKLDEFTVSSCRIPVVGVRFLRGLGRT